MGGMGKREDILEATRDLIAEEGIQSFSFPKIFARAGVGSGTVYHYFSSKEALIAAVYQEASAVMDSEVLQGYDPTAGIPDRFQGMMRNIVRFVSTRWKELAVLEACRHMPFLAEESLRQPPAAQATFDLLAQGRDQGILRHLDGMMVGAAMLGAVSSLVEGHRSGKFTLTEAAVDQTIAACWRALATPAYAEFTAGSGSSP